MMERGHGIKEMGRHGRTRLAAFQKLLRCAMGMAGSRQPPLGAQIGPKTANLAIQALGSPFSSHWLNCRSSRSRDLRLKLRK